MELAYKYAARTSQGARTEGVLFARNRPLAMAALKRSGLTPSAVDWHPVHTLQGLFHKEFNKAELARLYGTIGRRLRNGKSLVEGLEAAAEYVQDARLRQAVAQMSQALIDGQDVYGAMLTAGFPRRDCLVIRSTSEAGRTGDSFVALGQELQRSEALRKSVAATFRLPAVMGVFMALFVWAALMYIAPATLAFLKQTGLKLHFSALLTNYFELVRLFHIQPWVSTAIYFTGLGLLIQFLRSNSFKAMLDRFKTLRNLSMKSDYAALWSSFSMLYDAAVPAREAAAIVGDAARRPDARASFKRMAKLVEAGRSLDDAVASAGFPPFVVAGVSSAVTSGDVVEGLTDLARNLQEDAETLASVLQENAKIVSVLAMGAGILIVFLFTYYPMLASVMSNV